MQKWIAELKAKTGRTLERVGRADAERTAQTTVTNRASNGCGTRTSSATTSRGRLRSAREERVSRATTPEAYLEAAEKYVDEQYSGKKASLRPIYDELLELGRSVAQDVKACPCQTMVPFYRNHVFAQIKPTTNSRIDLGFALAKYKGKLPKRMIDTGGLAKKDRITHRIEITEAGQIDDDVRKWLKTAYDLDAD